MKSLSSIPAGLKAFTVEIVVIISILLAIIVLNYFNILPISRFFPDLLGWLPHMMTQEETVKEQEVVERNKQVYDAQPLLFVCPLDPEICPEGKAVFSTEARAVTGFTYTGLSENTPLYAPMDSDYTIEKSTINNEEVITVTFTRTEGDFEITYTFQGILEPEMSLSGGTAKQKQIVARGIGGRLPLVPYTSQLYGLYVTLSDSVTGKIYPVMPSVDGKGLTIN